MSKTFEQGKDEVAALCSYFERNKREFFAAEFKEAEVCQTLIQPFFEALGWDVGNAARAAPQYREVIPQPALDVEGAARAPDYAFRVGSQTRFYVEAKKCGINIGIDPAPAFQLRRYGWSAKLALSILTDFDELAVYDCTSRPRPKDKASHARVQYFGFKDYPDRWRELWDVFSREAVWSGAFDEYAASKRKRGTSEVDDEFLKEIESWREALARNIALRNREISSDDLNAAVQMTIDRVVFLRMAEDRGLEPQEQLLRLCERVGIYSRFIGKVCHDADEKYNSGLFHFHKEDGVSESPDRITTKLVIDDKVFKPILESLYFAHGSPYDFGVMPVEILGTVYERFLGKVIRLTAGHQAKLEEKPEVRKAGGVYYTPVYIVDYIVKKTVGPQVLGKSPMQLAGGRGRPTFRVLDMACGSGSFLLGAYQFLLDYFLAWYVANNPDEFIKAVYKDHRSEQWRLTIAEKKRILTAHVFGVDIDRQAVEVTKLSLLLKALEGENDVTLSMQIKLFDKQRALPNLVENIKCGNSLIGQDFFSERLLGDVDEIRRVNPFDWRKEFAAAMRDGGFDCVIGNPPWGATLDRDELEYLRIRHMRVIARMIDSYIYFTDKASQLAKEHCPVGYIIPATLLNQTDALPLRNILLERGLTSLVNLGQGIFGKKVLNTSSIFVSGVGRSLELADLSSLPIESRPSALMSVPLCERELWETAVRSDPHHTFFTANLIASAILDRLRSRFKPLEAYIEGSIQRGVSPDIAAAHVLTRVEASRLRLEKDLIRPSISGSQIKRFRPWKSDQVIIYTTRDTDIEKYPRCRAHLAGFKSSNKCKEVSTKKHPWWALHRPRDPSIFQSPKLVGLTTTREIELTLDESEGLFVTDAMYVFAPVPGISPKALMAVMQSRVFGFLYRVANTGEAPVIPQIKASKISTLPIPNIVGSDTLVELVDRMLALNIRLVKAESASQRSPIERQLATVDAQIDAIVNEMYGLAPEEIAIVEGPR